MNHFKSLILFISAVVLHSGCGNTTPDNNTIPYQLKENDYWNDAAYLQKVVDTCSGFFLPHYLPLRYEKKTIKTIIPGDTIILQELITNRIVLKNSEVLYFNINGLTNKIWTNRAGNFIPFLSGFIKTDSLLNLYWQEKFSLKENNLLPDSVVAENIKFTRVLNPCLNKENKDKAQVPYACAGYLCLVTTPVLDTLRFNTKNKEIDVIDYYRYKTYNEENLKQNLPAVVNPEYETTTEQYCLKLEIELKENTPPSNINIQRFSVWLEKEKGPVKIKSHQNGEIYFISF
jgi:hypothetical protein